MKNTCTVEIETHFPTLHHSHERSGRVLQGEAAGLDSLRSWDQRRQFLSSPILRTRLEDKDSEEKHIHPPSKLRKLDSQSECMYDHDLRQQHLPDEGEKEFLLILLPSFLVRVVTLDQRAEEAEGVLFVTTHRILFLAVADKAYDLAIDATSLSLHAMTSDPEVCVYCQLSSDTEFMAVHKRVKDTSSSIHESSDVPTSADSDDDEEDSTITDGFHMQEETSIEIFFIPRISTDPSDNDSSQEQRYDNEKNTFYCEELFKALGKLVALNPVYGDDEDFDHGNGLGALLGMLSQGTDDDDFDGDYDGNDEDEFVYRIDNSNNTHELDYGDSMATNEQRQAMLDRLDSVLLVPQEYEIATPIDGQFDDAEDGEDLL